MYQSTAVCLPESPNESERRKRGKRERATKCFGCVEREDKKKSRRYSRKDGDETRIHVVVAADVGNDGVCVIVDFPSSVPTAAEAATTTTIECRGGTTAATATRTKE